MEVSSATASRLSAFGEWFVCAQPRERQYQAACCHCTFANTLLGCSQEPSSHSLYLPVPYADASLCVLNVTAVTHPELHASIIMQFLLKESAAFVCATASMC